MARRGQPGHSARLVAQRLASGTAMAAAVNDYLAAIAAKDFSPYMVAYRSRSLAHLVAWLAERGVDHPAEVTKPVLERYQRSLFYHRKADGAPLSFRTQNSYLVPVKALFRWLAQTNRILFNPASELELPRIERRLPKVILGVAEVESVLVSCDLDDPVGLRDRAIMDVLYSTGMRRSEACRLRLHDIDIDRGVVTIVEGKGRRDRMVPIGERALVWVDRYVADARAGFVVQISTTQIYTHVSIDGLKAVHTRCHPGATNTRHRHPAPRSSSSPTERSEGGSTTERSDGVSRLPAPTAPVDTTPIYDELLAVLEIEQQDDRTARQPARRPPSTPPSPSRRTITMTTPNPNAPAVAEAPAPLLLRRLRVVTTTKTTGVAAGRRPASPPTHPPPAPSRPPPPNPFPPDLPPTPTFFPLPLHEPHFCENTIPTVGCLASTGPRAGPREPPGGATVRARLSASGCERSLATSRGPAAGRAAAAPGQRAKHEESAPGGSRRDATVTAAPAAGTAGHGRDRQTCGLWRREDRSRRRRPERLKKKAERGCLPRRHGAGQTGGREYR